MSALEPVVSWVRRVFRPAPSPRIPPIVVEIPIALRSSANLREHPQERAKRVRAQRNATRVALSSYRLASALGDLRAALASETRLAVVRLVRLAPRELDSDNLESAFKAIRDEIADVLEVDDGDRPRVRFFSYPERAPFEAVRIEIEAVGKPADVLELEVARRLYEHAAIALAASEIEEGVAR